MWDSYYAASSAWEWTPAQPSTYQDYATVSPSVANYYADVPSWQDWSTPGYWEPAPSYSPAPSAAAAPVKAAPKVLSGLPSTATTIQKISDIGAIGQQKKIENKDGSYTLATRISDDSYQVQKYRSDGSFQSSEVRKDGSVSTEIGSKGGSGSTTPPKVSSVSTVVSSKPPEANIKLAVQAVAGPKEIHEMYGGPAGEGENKGLSDIVSQAYSEYVEPYVSPVVQGAKDIYEGITSDSEEKKSSPSTEKPSTETVKKEIEYFKPPETPATPETFDNAVKKDINEIDTALTPKKDELSPVVDAILPKKEQVAPVAPDPSFKSFPTDIQGVVTQKTGYTFKSQGVPETSFSAGGPPETEDELAIALGEALDKYNPDGVKNGVNARIAAYFPHQISSILQLGLNAKDIADLTVLFEAMRDGEISSSQGVFVSGKGFIGEQTREAFKDLDIFEQRKAIQELYAASVNVGLPEGYSLQLIRGLVESETQDGKRQNDIDYIVGGTFEKDLHAFGSGSPIKNIESWVNSRAGTMTIGAAFNLIPAAVGLFAAGPVGALVGVKAGAIAGGITTATMITESIKSLQTLPFSSTEWENLRTGDYWRTREQLKSEGLDASSKNMQFDQSQKSATSVMDAFKFDFNKASPELRLQEYEDALKSHDEWGKNLRENAIFLDFHDRYWKELLQWQEAGKTLANKASMMDKTTGQLIQGAVLPSTITIIPPPGGKVLAGEFGTSSDAPLVVSPKGEGSFSYQIMDSNGKVLKVYDTYYGPGIVSTKDHSQAIDLYGKSASPEVTQEQKAAQYAYMEAQELAKTAIVMNTSPSSTVLIDGKEFASQGSKNEVPLQPGYHSVVVKTEGKKDWEKTVYIGKGEKVTISDATESPFTPYQSQKKASSGGGGGGGGGGSGGSSKPSKSTQALIKYGETCRGARIWQDDIEIAPEIDQIYGIDPGYHAIVVQKEGKKEWTKTVYCIAGDTLTVSPALEDEEKTTPEEEEEPAPDEELESTVRRVYFNSNPYSARVLINGGFSGEWTPCFLDLEYGYYKVKILKTGYYEKNTSLYVGPSIYWGAEADNVAKAEGIYFE